MVSKAWPYMVTAFDQIAHLDPGNITNQTIDRVVREGFELALELEDWVRVNSRGKWRRCMLEFSFVRAEDAAMFRLRVGDNSRAYIHPSKLPKDDNGVTLAASQPRQEAEIMAKGQKKKTKEAKKPKKDAKSKKAKPAKASLK